MYKKILLPTDGSENAKRAGEEAISIADLSGADVTVLYVIDDYYLEALPQPDLRKSMHKMLREDGRRAVEHFKEKLEESQCEGKCKNVNFTTEIREGKPYAEILKTIKEGIDLVVMGASGKHGLEKFVLGNTADSVVRGTIVPVKVVY